MEQKECLPRLTLSVATMGMWRWGGKAQASACFRGFPLSIFVTIFRSSCVLRESNHIPTSRSTGVHCGSFAPWPARCHIAQWYRWHKVLLVMKAWLWLKYYLILLLTNGKRKVVKVAVFRSKVGFSKSVDLSGWLYRQLLGSRRAQQIGWQLHIRNKTVQKLTLWHTRPNFTESLPLVSNVNILSVIAEKILYLLN